MASASTSIGVSIALHRTTSHKETLFLGPPRTTISYPILPHHPSFRTSVLTFSRRRRNTTAPSPMASKKVNKKKLTHKTVKEDDNIDEDAFDSLFHMLEEDLKNDNLSVKDGEDDDITEEEMLKLEHELAEALADDELLGALASNVGGETENEVEEEDDDENEGESDDDEEEEEEMPLNLKNWQLRRLAYALRNGRRKTSIKNLAAELCLDRAVVLQLLRDPPPNLVMMSVALPDQPVSTILEPAEKTDTTVPTGTLPMNTTRDGKPETEAKLPVHVMQNNWSAQKRLKKVQLETLEQVYRRTKRPTNAMISSIVHVTNLPRKKVVKWFEDRRAEDGVPDSRIPYRRSAPETVFTS
ncbi:OVEREXPRESSOR OF CATIONIC PEROXIDASE 3 [Olea europaea subsp. europaea]|uniref:OVEREXPRESSOR OF CATIONIC PEROXIDASE 3 n=2 Tax=Olea europaea subsp. europaea TaxID=158383 RepID=A0A8S0PDH8_OLEEU|nr:OVEREXPRESSOR OF CATIONIC PEROXIDASE 3 [Olea europaea subsp. europaea]